MERTHQAKHVVANKSDAIAHIESQDGERNSLYVHAEEQNFGDVKWVRYSAPGVVDWVYEGSYVGAVRLRNKLKRERRL